MILVFWNKQRRRVKVYQKTASFTNTKQTRHNNDNVQYDQQCDAVKAVLVHV